MFSFLLVFASLSAVAAVVDDYSKPVCHCWTRACNFCQDARCGVKYDLNQGQLHLNSKISRGSYNILVLYNSAGAELGRLMFKLGRLILTGCVQMLTHARLPKHVWRRGQTTDWSVSLQNYNITVRVGEWEQSEALVGECKEWYGNVAYFAFQQPAECKSAAEGGAHFTSSADMLISREYYLNCVKVCS